MTRTNISQELLLERLKNGFRCIAADEGRIPNLLEVIEFDQRAGEQPPLTVTSTYRNAKKILAERRPEVLRDRGVSDGMAYLAGLRVEILDEDI